MKPSVHICPEDPFVKKKVFQTLDRASVFSPFIWPSRELCQLASHLQCNKKNHSGRQAPPPVSQRRVLLWQTRRAWPRRDSRDETMPLRPSLQTSHRRGSPVAGDHLQLLDDTGGPSAWSLTVRELFRPSSSWKLTGNDVKKFCN